ncbi:hypothetical protein L198_06884 [Cryptococcus wingfieldii CBS 7118]|uniref:Uncharacterized protein n=1 Tax=Cryptococcus wingfieldii CBS 7118 TaxID=1295528 RepID=A0A1E3IHP9_9TREE|nr:hypothetical protein L198_06884 [Cryptococcus wingfieldii CBS 7118]ODN88120.1 hypothetical protein L198_06884 [Cryptococcus wingfieldii CBS 7118]
MSSPAIAARIAHVRLLVRAFPSTPLSGPAQLSNALDSILNRALAATKASSSSPQSGAAAGASAVEVIRAKAQEQKIAQTGAAVQRLKAGNAMRQYPLSKHIVTPVNDPLFYTRTRNAIHNAEKGIKRTWWKVFFNVKGAE